jgi:hypothetical protein
MKTLGVLFAVWFAWVWIFPIALGLLIACGYGLVMGVMWLGRRMGALAKRIDRWQTRRWSEKNLGYCFCPGCAEFATQDLYVYIRFKEKDGLKEKWRVCKGCAKQLDEAEIKTQWLSWIEFHPDGWTQAAPKDGTSLKVLKTIWPRGVHHEQG